MIEIEKGSHYIKTLISQGEGLMLDFKFAINDSKKIARSLSAFANTDGGTLLIGVKDNGAIAGVRSDEEFYMLEAASSVYTSPVVPFCVKYWEINDRTVLEVKIEKSHTKPHLAPDKDNLMKAYIRVEDKNIVANKVLLKVWSYQNSQHAVKIKYSRKEEILLSYLNEFGTITFSKFQRIAEISRHTAEDILADFIMLDIIEMVITEQIVVYKLKDKINNSL